jgi:hypothetical protein
MQVLETAAPGHFGRSSGSMNSPPKRGHRLVDSPTGQRTRSSFAVAEADDHERHREVLQYGKRVRLYRAG